MRLVAGDRGANRPCCELRGEQVGVDSGPTPDAIMQLGLGFWGSKTLLSAVELGLFSELASAGALDADALRERLGLHPLAVKVRALANKNRGMDTFRAVEALGLDPDVRDYSIVAPMLRALGVASVRLLTGNPEKARAIAKCGIEVREVLPLTVATSPEAVQAVPRPFAERAF